MKFKILATVKNEIYKSGAVKEGLLLDNLGIIYLDNTDIIQGRVVDKFLNIEIINGKIELSITEN